MVPESIFCTAALMMNLLALPSQSSVRDIPNLTKEGAFHTERLSPRQIRLWNAIQRVAAAQDSQGSPLHPTLDGLWRAVEHSGHLVFIELITDKERASNVAGETVVEKFDPTGRMHSLRIKLFIATIDRAYGGELPPREGLEFVPFAGLRHETRYAKVLGHELAHIEKALRDPEYLHLLQEICMEQSAIAAGIDADGQRLSELVLKERVDRVWPLVLESERPALAAEAQIRRELLVNSPGRSGRLVYAKSHLEKSPLLRVRSLGCMAGFPGK